MNAEEKILHAVACLPRLADEERARLAGLERLRRGDDDPDTRAERWRLDGPYAEQAELRVFRGYPVLIHGAGHYPQAINSKGRSTKDSPHVALTRSWTGWEVWAKAGHSVPVPRRGKRPAWRLIAERLERREDAEPFLLDAVECLPRLADEAQARMEAEFRLWDEARAEASKISNREDYEGACRRWGLTPKTDTEVLRGTRGHNTGDLLRMVFAQAYRATWGDYHGPVQEIRVDTRDFCPVCNGPTSVAGSRCDSCIDDGLVARRKGAVFLSDL